MRSGKRSMPGPNPEKKLASSKKARPALAAQFYLLRRHCEAGEFVAGERLCRQMLMIVPGHPQVIQVLGQLLWSQERHQEAIAALAPLVERWPAAGEAHFCLGNALHSAARYAEAAKHLHRAAELLPHVAAAHCNLGLALEKLGDRAGAIRAYERAVSLEPNLGQAHANLGVALFNARQPENAIIHLRRAVALDPTASNPHLYLGLALQQIDKIEEALSWYERVAFLQPTLAAGWIGIGSALRALGRFPEAIAAYEKALAIDPDLGAARLALAHLAATPGKGRSEAAEVDRPRGILTNPKVDAHDRGAARMAMAKTLDDSGRYDEAFAAAVEGNRLARAGQQAANIRYDHDAFRAQNDALMRVFTSEFFAATRGWGNRSELPVFIVGYFRTGSTLVEQICASHSGIHGVGESRNIPQIAAEIQRIAPARWTPRLFRRFADRHAERLAALAPGKLRVVDKMLDNIYRLGMIAAMFPGARVIFTHRDGRDAALSTFMQHFEPQVAFATDLLDVGRRWHETERMSAYWARCLPLSMYHVQYETLVADFETEARKLIEFLGLAWEPACLDYNKTERAVQTASTWQVRQPLYVSSVGRWRNYAKHLAPLCATIGLDPEAPTGTRPESVR
jgi:tetratricopeptide (TPR) repeat protein